MGGDIETMEAEGLGSYLQRERIERGIPLQEVSEFTRIRSFYLERIEVSELHRLPAVPIGRGFVRAYASYIGVDPDTAAMQFDREVGYQAEDAGIELPKPTGIYYSQSSPYSRPGGRSEARRLSLPLVAVIVFVIASGALLWMVRGKTQHLFDLSGISERFERIKAATAPALERLTLLGKGPPRKEGVAETGSKNGSSSGLPVGAGEAAKKEAPPGVREETPSDQLAEDGPVRYSPSPADGESGPEENGDIPAAQDGRPGLPELTPARAETNEEMIGEAPMREHVAPDLGPGTVAGSNLPPVVSAIANGSEGSLELKVIAVEDTWLRVVVDQKSRYELLLTAGNAKNWRGQDRFVVTVGNVYGTRILLNGSDVSLPRTSTNVVHDFIITDKKQN